MDRKKEQVKKRKEKPNLNKETECAGLSSVSLLLQCP